MEDFRKDQLGMIGVLTPWLTLNLPAIGQSKLAKKEAEDVIAGHPALLGKAGQTAVQTTEVTRRRNKQMKAFQKHIFALSGPMRLLAGRANDINTLALVTIGRTAFKGLRPLLQAGVGQKIMAAAQTQAATLADSGMDAAYLATAALAVKTFADGLPDTQTLLDARKNANATYEEVHAAQMQQVYELDLAMAVFETLNPTLYREYKQARAILDTGAQETAAAGQTPKQ